MGEKVFMFLVSIMEEYTTFLFWMFSTSTHAFMSSMIIAMIVIPAGCVVAIEMRWWAILFGAIVGALLGALFGIVGIISNMH